MKSIRKLLVLLLTACLVSTSLGTAVVFAQGDGTQEHATGLLAPTAEQQKLFDQYAKPVVQVLPNERGLERINMERQARGLEALPPDYAAGPGEEIITNSNSKSLEAKYGAELSTLGDVLGSLPEAVDNSATPYFPAIGDQGHIGSCASFAITYYAATYETAQTRNIDLSGHPNKVLSPRFTYNLSNDGMDMGSSFDANINAMLTHGVPFADEASMASYQYNGYDSAPSQYMAYPADAQIWRDALKNRLAGVDTVNGTNTPSGLAQIKQMLNNEHVLVFGTDHIFAWQYKTVSDDPATPAHDPYTGQSAACGMVVKNEFQPDGHALTIVGYDDSIWVDINGNGITEGFEKGALKLANSWGTGWSDGNSGFVWLAYDALQSDNGHRDVISGDQAIYLEAQAEYTPIATADVTINTARRDKLSLFTGMNWNEANEPRTRRGDNIFNGGWGGPLSFAGTEVASTATIVVDLSDYINGSEFKNAGGALTYSLGVGDTVQKNDEQEQTVLGVTFHGGGGDFPALEAMPVSIHHALQWFGGKHILNTGISPPAYAADVADLETMQPGAYVYTESRGPSDVREWQFTPAQTGTYSFSNGINDDASTIAIENESRRTLREDVYYPGDTAELTAMLYAGKTYVLRTWYAGSTGPADIEAFIRMDSPAPASTESANLSGMSLSAPDGFTPAFAAGSYSYRSVLSSGNTTLNITPESTNAYVLIDDKIATNANYTLPSGTARLARVDVTSKDWQTTHTYRAVLSYGMPSTDATLSAIQLSKGALAAPFDPAVMEYNATYPVDTESITLSAAKNDSNASVIINGVRRNDTTITLRYGDTTDVHIKVTAQDLATSNTYTIHVKRDDLNVISRGANAPLYNALHSSYPSGTDMANDGYITAHELRLLAKDNTTLMLANKNITDITGLQYCTSLAALNVSGNNITSIPDLSALKSLKTLNLSANNLTNLSGAERIPALESLSAASNKITDIGALQSVRGLKTLDLQANVISDIGALSGLGALYEVHLNSNYISDISALQGLGRSAGTVYLEVESNLLNPGSPSVTNVIRSLPGGTVRYTQQKTFNTHFYAGSHAFIGNATPFNGQYYSSGENYYFGQGEAIPYIRPDSGYQLLGWDTNGDGMPEIPRGQNITFDTQSIPRDGVHKSNYAYDVCAVCAIIPPEMNGKLFNIAASTGALTTDFNYNRFSYTLYLDENTASTTITPIKINLESKMTLAGSSKATSTTVKLDPGKSKTIKIVVYRDKKVKFTYTVNVVRAKSSDTNLASLTAAGLSPSFSNGVQGYSIILPANKKSIAIKAKAASKYTAVLFNGRKASSKTVSLKNGQSIIVAITVRSQVGTTKTFTVTVRRN